MKADTAERYAALLDDLPAYAALVFLLRGDTDGKLFAPGGKTPAAAVAAAVRKQGLVVEFKKATAILRTAASRSGRTPSSCWWRCAATICISLPAKSRSWRASPPAAR